MSEVFGPFDARPPAVRDRVIAPASVLAGSLLGAWPVIAAFPVLPPVGLMLLLGWRLRRPETLPVWAPLPLGLFDDLVSGQPLGNAMLLWTLAFFAVDLIERRLMLVGSFAQEWVIAAGAIAACLTFGRLLATPFGAHVDTLVLLQIVGAALLYPLAAGLVGRLDARRARP